MSIAILSLGLTGVSVIMGCSLALIQFNFSRWQVS